MKSNMIPKRFPECNQTFKAAMSDGTRFDLHIWLSENKGKEMVTCFHVPFWERIRLLFTGEIWYFQMTHGRPQPYQISLHKDDFIDDAKKIKIDALRNIKDGKKPKFE